jgi:hypothetical protein
VDRTLIGEPAASQAARQVVFSVDINTGRLISVAPVVHSDGELDQLDQWIDGCIFLSGLIHPRNRERAAA